MILRTAGGKAKNGITPAICATSLKQWRGICRPFSFKIIQGFGGFSVVHGLINPAQIFGTSFLWYSEKTEIVLGESEAILTDKAISAIATKLVLTTQSQKYAVEIGNVRS